MKRSGISSENQYNQYQENLINAQVIQQGLLPKERHFKRLYDNYFTLYFPQNIVSGDFYWVGTRNGFKYLVVGDCTGHGVSAALLSVLALNLFEYTIMNKGCLRTSKILKEVDKKFIESFKNVGRDQFDNPWIDLSIVCIDEKKKKLYYSGANRKLLVVDKHKNKTLYKGSRYPVGGWQIKKLRQFEHQVINYTSGDKLYLDSDGFQDQIGGPSNKKYKSRNLHEFLVSNSDLTMKEQKKQLEKEFYSWKKNEPQLDDVCIIGVELK